MAVQKVLPVQNPALRSQAKPVQSFDKRIQKLIKDLQETITAQQDPEGVGLAAPQLGVLSRLFIIRSARVTLTFINPEIIWKSKETNDPSTRSTRSGQVPPKKQLETGKSKLENEYIMEGCLSLPHYYGPVQRAKAIRVRYQEPRLITNRYSLVTVTKSLTGLPAQIVQHEVDHLNGIVFIDRLLSQKRKLYHWTGKDWEEVELP